MILETVKLDHHLWLSYTGTRVSYAYTEPIIYSGNEPKLTGTRVRSNIVKLSTAVNRYDANSKAYTTLWMSSYRLIIPERTAGAEMLS